MTGNASPSSGAVTGCGLAVLAGWYLTVLVGFGLWVSSLPAVKTDGSCDGIGFGCTPNPRDGALIVGIFYGLPVLALSAVISLVALAIAVAARVRSGLVAGNIAALAGVLGVAMTARILVS